jgi:hypothetical protein
MRGKPSNNKKQGKTAKRDSSLERRLRALMDIDAPTHEPSRDDRPRSGREPRAAKRAPVKTEDDQGAGPSGGGGSGGPKGKGPDDSGSGSDSGSDSSSSVRSCRYGAKCRKQASGSCPFKHRIAPSVEAFAQNGKEPFRVPKAYAARYQHLLQPVPLLNIELVEYVGDSELNPHRPSAMVRLHTLNRVLMMAHAAGYRHGTDMYGSPRTIATLKRLNRNCSEPMTMAIYRPVITVADFTRRVSDEYCPERRGYGEFLMFNDVYRAHDRAIDAQYFADLYRLLPHVRVIYFIHKDFRGTVGTCERTGAWMRRGDTVETFADDDTGYTSHPSLTWLCNPGSAVGVAWERVATYSDTIVTIIVRGEYAISRTAPPPRFEFVEATVSQSFVYWAKRLGAALFPTHVATPMRATRWVDRDLLTRAVQLRAGKPYSKDVYLQLCADVRRVYEADDEWKVIVKYFGQHLTTMVEDTVSTAFAQSAAHSADLLTALRANHGDAFARYSSQLMALATPTGVRALNVDVPIRAFAIALIVALFTRRGNALVRYVIRRLFGAVPLIQRAVTWAAPAADSGNPFEFLCRPESDILSWLDRQYGLPPHFGIALAAPIVEEPLRSILGPWFGVLQWLRESFVVYGAAQAEVRAGTVEAKTAQVVIGYQVVMKGFGQMLLSTTELGIVARSFWHGLFNFAAAIDTEAQIARSAGHAAPIPPILAFVMRFICINVLWPKVPPACVMTDFVARYHSGQPDVVFQPAPEGVYPYAPAMALVPRDRRPSYQPKPRCPLLVARGRLELPKDRDGNPVWYALCFDAPMMCPAPVLANWECMVETRLLAAAPMPPDEQYAAWRRRWPHVMELMDAFVLERGPMQRDILLEPFFEHHRRTGKYALYYRCDEQNMENPVDERLFGSTQVMCKFNEVVIARTETHAGRVVNMKVRNLENVKPRVSPFAGPFTHEVGRIMDQEWSTDEVTFKQFDGFKAIALCYGSKCTAERLSRWASNIAPECLMAVSRLMLQQRAVAPNVDPATVMAACALFAGDDLLLVVADGHARLYYFESDFSAYDASISLGPLSVQYIGFQRWGVPDFVVDVLRAISTSKLRVSGLTIDRSARPQRATGAPDTTCGNGFVTAFATALVVLNAHHSMNGITADSVQEGFAQLGFKAKVRAQNSMTDCTFLKGLFYPACDSAPVAYQWAPLPSRVIKASNASATCALYTGRVIWLTV